MNRLGLTWVVTNTDVQPCSSHKHITMLFIQTYDHALHTDVQPCSSHGRITMLFITMCHVNVLQFILENRQAMFFLLICLVNVYLGMFTSLATESPSSPCVLTTQNRITQTESLVWLLEADLQEPSSYIA